LQEGKCHHFNLDKVTVLLFAEPFFDLRDEK
jgi:hypothetical protein